MKSYNDIIKLEETPERLEVIRALASRNSQEAIAAREAFAAFVGPQVAQVLDQLSTSSLIFRESTYTRGDDPSIPVDLFYGNGEGTITVWHPSIAGGLASNLITGMDEFRFTILTIATAISFLENYVRDARIDVVTLGIKRAAQEMLVKEDYFAWTTVLGALAGLSGRPNGAVQIIPGSTPGQFKIDDLNRLWTLVKRSRNSWAGGTPVSTPGRGLTHLIISPEVAGDIRAFSYNPQNQTVVPAVGSTSTAMPLPDDVRSRIFNSAVIPELFGVGFIELNELGVGQAYNEFFGDVYSPQGSEPTFNPATQEIVIGVDLSLPSFVKMVERDPAYGNGTSSVVAEVDDQFVRRQRKIGWYFEKNVGFGVFDVKNLAGIII